MDAQSDTGADRPREVPRPVDERAGVERAGVDGRDRPAVREEVAISLVEVRRRDRRASWASHNWAYVLAVGIAAVVFGTLLLVSAFSTLSALVWLTGLYLVFMGLFQLVTLGSGGQRGARLIGAAVAVAGGLVLLLWPGETLTVLAVVAGITFLASGAIDLVAAFLGPREERLTEAARGAALAALGALMIVWPGPTVTVLGIVLGLIALVWGVSMIAGALALRKTGREWEEMREERRSRLHTAA
jgi:uncharacterized membrane protein HdeD (DUF308 family)